MPATILQDAVTPTILTSPSVTPSDTSATVFFNVTPPTGKVAGIWLEYTTSTDASWASVASVLGKTYIATATSESITTPSTLTSGTPYKYRLGVQINDSAVTYFPSANGGSFTTTTISNVNPIALGTVSVPTTTSISADYTLNLPTGAPTLTRHVGYSTTGTAGSYIFPSELSGGSATSQSYTSSITGLTSGSTYFVRIELREAGGAVYASQQTSSGTQVPTNPITVFSVVQGTTPTTLSVTFTAPITGSQVRQIRYGSTTVDITSSTSAYTITGLTANINYTVVMEILTAAQGGQVYATSSQVRATTAANSINSFSSSILRATEATFSYGVTTGATASFTVNPSTGVTQDTSLAGTLRLTGLAVGTPYSVTLSSILNGVTSTSTPLSITTKTPDVWKAIGDFVTRYYRIESGQTQTNQARISGINLSSITDLSGAIDGISSYTTGTAFDPLKADSISDDNRSIVNNRYTQALTDLTNVLNNVLPFRAALNAFNTNYTTTVQSNITGLPQTSVLSTAITQLSNYSTDAAILSNRLTTAPSVPPDYTQANNDLTFLTGTVLPFRTAVTTFGDKYYSNITKVTGTIDGAKYPNLQTAITRLDQSKYQCR
jgi:hypothetical protein